MSSLMQIDSVISTTGLTKHYRLVQALTDFDCEIARGEVVGLLGPNGSGKSTLVRLLMGFLKPTSGTASILGIDCSTHSVDVHRLVAYMPGDARMFRSMRGKDVLQFFGSIRGGDTVGQSQAIARRLDLDLSRWVAFMSTGMRQKLALAVVFSFDTPVMILDEPTSNLDPTVRHEVLTLIKEEAKEAGRTVIFCSHVLSEIEDVCDRVLILRAGRLVHQQAVRDLNQIHHIRATFNGPAATVPSEVCAALNVTDGQLATPRNGEPLLLQVDTGEKLSVALQWLSQCPLESMEIQRLDLRHVYEQFHRAL